LWENVTEGGGKRKTYKLEDSSRTRDTDELKELLIWEKKKTKIGEDLGWKG